MPAAGPIRADMEGAWLGWGQFKPSEWGHLEPSQPPYQFVRRDRERRNTYEQRYDFR